MWFVSVAPICSFVILADGCTTVPVHKGRDISPPLLRQIARDIGMTPEQFLSHR